MELDTLIVHPYTCILKLILSPKLPLNIATTKNGSKFSPYLSIEIRDKNPFTNS